MKTVFTIVAGITLLLLAGCTDFPTKYSVIEDENTRLIDFIYEPAEAAPGDTVL